MLAPMAIAVPPSAWISATTSWQASILRLEMVTRAPCRASSTAMARPMPRDEPVTRAVLPLRSNSEGTVDMGGFLRIPDFHCLDRMLVPGRRPAQPALPDLTGGLGTPI